jgi:putative DNA primase/helicase
MKQYTDFNDLATKSVLGSQGVERQVQPIVASLLGRQQGLVRRSGRRAFSVRRIDSETSLKSHRGYSLPT